MKSEDIIIIALIMLIITSVGVYAFITSMNTQSEDNNATLNMNSSNNTGSNITGIDDSISSDSGSSQTPQGSNSSESGNNQISDDSAQTENENPLSPSNQEGAGQDPNTVDTKDFD